jgi:hypothetical protein
VTFASSIVQTKSIKYDVMTDTPARKKMCADQRYGQSKFVRVFNIRFALSLLTAVVPPILTLKANVLIANEFARRYGDAGIHFNSLDPGQPSLSCSSSFNRNAWFVTGGIKTNLQQHMPGLMRTLLVRKNLLFLYPYSSLFVLPL